jgi:uncharacterized membrane protein YqaE (UPF0057 family)
MSSSKYTNRLDADKKRKEERNKSISNSGGAFAKIFIYLIKNIFIDIVLTTFYNMTIDIFSDSFQFVDEMFFSDFKGVLAGKFKSKNGFCFEYTYIRYFITIMIPPMGVFLARGISSWFNLLVCGILSLVHYFPGLIYALIVIQSAPYANRYQEMKRDKLEKERAKYAKEELKEFTPMIIFGLTLLLVIVFMLISLGVDPNQKVISSFNNVIQYIQPARALSRTSYGYGGYGYGGYGY